jgi:hypothetical protein
LNAGGLAHLAQRIIALAASNSPASDVGHAGVIFIVCAWRY